VRVNSSRDEHNLRDLVYDEHANHRHCHSKQGPYDTELPRMFVDTIVSYKIDVKAMPLEDAVFLNTICSAKTTLKEYVVEEPATLHFHCNAVIFVMMSQKFRRK
jgi:hypothetical protein